MVSCCLVQWLSKGYSVVGVVALIKPSKVGMAGTESVMLEPHGDDTNSCQVEPSDLSGFTLKNVLSFSNSTKSIFLEGTLSNNSSPIVLLLEKEPFDEKDLKELFSGENKNEKIFQNDIYSNFRYLPTSACNGIKITSIYPATEKHIEKYSFQPLHIINETPDLYTKITLPHLQSEQFSLQWVYNILEHKSETERILYEDSDPETGFILLPDLKWDGINIDNFYVLALPIKRGILSLRDLTDKELPLVKNIYEKSLKVIEEKYKIQPSFIQAYFHYQPSFYHLHIHFRHIQSVSFQNNMEKFHFVTTVLNNISLVPNYYQLSTIPFSVKETDSLFKKYEKEGLVKRVGK